MLKQHFDTVKNKATNLRLAADLLSHDSLASKAKNIKYSLEIQKIIKRYRGKPEELVKEAFNWVTYQAQLGFIFSNENLGNSVGNLDNFFHRGHFLEFD